MKKNDINKVDIDLLNRSLSRSSDEMNTPSVKHLRFMARHSRHAQKIIDRMIGRAISYVAYIQHMQQAVAQARTDCVCNFLVFGNKCRKFARQMKRLMDDFGQSISRKKIFSGVKPEVFAKKLVLTSALAQ